LPRCISAGDKLVEAIRWLKAWLDGAAAFCFGRHAHRCAGKFAASVMEFKYKFQAPDTGKLEIALQTGLARGINEGRR
jgi:hypothetical protein